MPLWGWICIGGFVIFVYLFVWSLCIVAGRADQMMERAMRENE